MTDKQISIGTHLEHLMDMALENSQGVGRVVADRARIGDFLAAGEGAVFGPRVNGIVRWDLYQDQGEFTCGSNMRGIIKTDDGAQIEFEALGYMLKANRAQPMVWYTTASMRFETEAHSYSWIKDVLGVLQGKFDMGINSHSYRVFAQIID